MNLLDIAIVAILAVYMISGMYRGFFVSVLSTLGFVGAWMGARRFYTQVANLALSNQTLMAALNQYLEPESFFVNHAQASTTVSEVIAGGETAIQAAIAPITEKISVISRAFEANVRGQMFRGLGINTLSDYLDQTIWQAIFNVAAFVLCFIALYILVSLIVNLLDHTISFPLVRGVDWLLGGLLGLVRGVIVSLLVLYLVPVLVQVVRPEFAESLRSGSQLYSLITQMDYLDVGNIIHGLIGA